MQQKKINYILKKSSEGANKYPIEDILSRFGVEYRIRGTQAWFRCPVCGKPKFDYCSATISGQGSGWWCCQACKTGGGTFRLYALLKGCSDTEALLSLGVLSGTITNEEYEEVTGTDDSRAKLKLDEEVRRKISEKKATETVERKAPVKLVDYIYRKMLSLEEFQLSEAGREYLRKERHYTDLEIEEMGFFTYNKAFSIEKVLDMVSRDKFKKSFYELDKEKVQELYNALWGVPGFYYKYKNPEKTLGVWKFVPPTPDCVGIPIRNGNGKISALQMRWIVENKGSKYFYISSRKYHQQKNSNYGSSPGTPVAVVYPETITGRTFYVTEGIFKAKELSKFGNVCFSVQGVNSFYYIADEVADTLKSRIYSEKKGKGAERIVLVFDSDSFTKWQVLEAAVKAAANISRKTEIPTYIMFWNPRLGKGFDDFKFNCEEQGIDYTKLLRLIDWRTFSDMAGEAIKDTDAYYCQLKGKVPEVSERDREWGNYLFFYLYEVRLSKI